MRNDIAIEATNLNKCYRIYERPHDRIKQALFGNKSQYYREFWALRDINFEIKKGESVGIIGRNGSGKSTLLQLLCKTLTPTSGKIDVNGKVAALLELGAGFNPQFTGRENVYINGAILGFNRHEIDKRFDEIAAFADIGNFIDQPVKNYSSGMFVRLAFAVQVCISPDILVIDEALAVGDIFFRQKCYKLLNKLLDQGVSIILVTHSMNEVEQFCQRALLLNQGKSIFLGAASEAVKRYYILDQEARNLTISQTEISSSEEDDLELKKLSWPSSNSFINISHISQITDGRAKCTQIAICDNEGNACKAFQQGDIASFFYEFELLTDIEVPLTGVVLQNDMGLNVHGKGTIEYGTTVPQGIKCGDRLRIRQDICLELAYGEYTFEIGLAAMSKVDYSQIMNYSHPELSTVQTRLCHLTNISCFAILPRTQANPVQLLHHGIANLPGNCQMIRVPPKEVEKTA